MNENGFIEERKDEFRRSAHTALYAEHKQFYDRVLWEETKRWLSESHGMIPSLDGYIEIFCQYIADNTDPYQPDKLQVLIIRKNIFEEVKDCFFNELDLEVQVTYSFVKPIISNGQCDVLNTKIGDNGKLELLKGKFVFQGNNVQSYASAMIAHEFTHAYEDYMRLKNGKKICFSPCTMCWRKFRKTVGKMIADIVTERGQVLDLGVNTNTLLTFDNTNKK